MATDARDGGWLLQVTQEEYDITGVQESSGQSLTTKALDKSGKVETAEKIRSTKELDDLADGDYTEQVIEDHFEEKKIDKDDEEEGLGKKLTPKAYKWLSWWKKRWPASGDLCQNYKKTIKEPQNRAKQESR